MASHIKISTKPWQIKRFKTNQVEHYIPFEGELVGDFRGSLPYLRMGDGFLPGGHVVMTGDVVGSVRKPRIVSPIQGAVGIVQSPYVTGSAYSASGNEGGVDVHAASTWFFSLDAAGNNIIHTSGRSTTHKTVYDLSAAGIALPRNARVYAWVVYESAGGLESTSAKSYFNTTA